MRSGANSVQHLLTPAALGVLKHAVSEARRRGHPQVQPLHVVSMLLMHAGSRLRQACMLSHPQNAQTAECRALEVCFNVALDHLPQSAIAMNGSSVNNQQQPPILSNALMAALKRAHAHQRRGCPEHQQSPLLAVKVEVDQLIISILDDPSVSRVMKEAGFSSTNVKFNLEDGPASTATNTSSGHGGAVEQHSVDVVSQVGSIYDASCVVSDDTETKSMVKFPPKVANSVSSWPQSEVVSLQEVRETMSSRPNQAVSVLKLPAAKDEDVQTILEILLRARNRNAILVGETTNATVEDLAVRIKNGNVPDQLQGLQFLDPKLSSSSFGYCSSLEMEQKLVELSKIVGECMPAGAILHIGDLQWLAEPMQLKKGPSNFCPAQRTAAELRQLLIRHANHRLWFVGVATPNVFARLQVLYPSLLSDWGFEPVQILALLHPSRPAFLQRLPINSQTVKEQIAMPLRTAPPMVASAPQAVQEESTECCADCLAKFEEERRAIHENESLSLQLAPVKWFPLSSNEAASGGDNGPMIPVKNRSVAQQLSQLQQVWQKRCRVLHGELVSVSPLTSRPQQPQLQSPLSRLSSSSHNKACGLRLDISSRWSGPDTSRQPQLVSSAVDQPLRSVPCYTAAREQRVEVQEANAKTVEAADLGSPKDGSSVASAAEDHEDLNGSAVTSTQHASLPPIHTNLALGRANNGLSNKLRLSPKSLSPSPLQKQHSPGSSPLSLKNSGKPLWMVQSPTQQQRLVKNTSPGGTPWQSSPLARRASQQSSSPSPSPSPSIAPTPFKEFVVDEALKGVYKGLMQRVPWQATAVAGIAATVMKCRSGSGNFRGATAKTDTWLLLLGPDPVAKQAIAKALAELVFGGERNLLHLGFGEGSLAKLDAAENGVRYRGRTPIDRLVEAVGMKKSAVILLEDVDQANSTVRLSLVRAMEIGKLADSNGREVSFGNTIVVMTTSIGSEMGESKAPPGSLSFSEEKLVALGGVGTICGTVKTCRSERVIFQAGKVVVVDNGAKQQQLGRRSSLSVNVVPSWVPKRKAQNGQLRLRTDAKRSTSSDRRGLNLDLNLATGDSCDSGSADDDCDEYDSEEAKLQKVLAEARDALSEKFCALPDYAVGFNAFDFNALAVEVLDGLGKSIAAHAFDALEIDVHLLEHLVSCVWKTPSGRAAFHTWLENVFATSVAGTRVYRNAVVQFAADASHDGFVTLALPHSVVFSSPAASVAAVV